VFAAALALCQPSLHEGFSIVIMESWLQGRPVLVHSDCAVTRSHVERSGGGYAFNDYASFSTALHTLHAEPAHAASLGQRGKAYVLQHYSWDAVIDRLLRGIVTLTRPRSQYARLAQRGIQRSLAFTPARFHDALLHVVEQARTAVGTSLSPHQHRVLHQLGQVGFPDYTVRSGLPLIGRLVAWTRRQLTSHLKEPYLDHIVHRQETFNEQLLRTLVPALEQSIHEQRRLKREVALLREQLARGNQAEQVEEGDSGRALAAGQEQEGRE
jgi:hypothetical protein